tara:strand:- start:1245 stop:1415 length:171 start_codon:yes stop_codon:yes gene_type:complete
MEGLLVLYIVGNTHKYKNLKNCRRKKFKRSLFLGFGLQEKTPSKEGAKYIKYFNGY